jgi:hypothetical protein
MACYRDSFTFTPERGNSALPVMDMFLFGMVVFKIML